MKKLACLLLALGAWSPFSASAAPDPYYHTTSVAWIVRTRNNIDVDDKYVTIIGHVTRRIGDDEYWFTDGTGQVRLDSDNFDLPIGRRIVIGGRIDQAYLGFGHLEVDVRRWRYAAPYHPHVVHTTTVVTRKVVKALSEAPAPVTAPAAPTTSTAPNSAPAQTAPALTPPAETTPTPTAPAQTTPPLAPPAGQ
jgi:uncharacterized protein (TIGR00156 family)